MVLAAIHPLEELLNRQRHVRPARVEVVFQITREADYLGRRAQLAIAPPADLALRQDRLRPL